MSQLEEAYLLGQQHYEMLLLQQIEAAQHGELEHAAMMEHAAGAEAQLVQHGYLAGMADYEAALVAEHEHAAAAEAAAGPPPSQEALEQEEAYQMGVALTDAQALVRQIEASASGLSGELKKAFDKGCDDCRSALEGPTDAEAPAKPKRKRKG